MPNRTLVYLACGALTVGPAIGAFAAETPTPTTASHAASTSPSTSTSAPSSSKATSTAPSSTSAGSTTSSTSAPPPAHADATALDIKGLLAIGRTSADASSTSAGATANALELGGSPLIDGTTGGTQSGNGSKKGALIDTGATPLGQLEVTPWSASATSAGGSSSADSEAALARLILADPSVLKVDVLQSSSHAKYDPTNGSSGNASSDGAVVNAGGGQLVVDLLHAESSSSGSGSSYLASINGQQIGSSDQANGQCTLTVPSLLDLSCLTATGGKGTGSSAADVATATLAGGQLPGVTAVGTTSKGAAAAASNGGTSDNGNTSVLGEKFPTGTSASHLPFTGDNTATIGALAALAVSAGAWLQQIGRRRRRGMATS